MEIKGDRRGLRLLAYEFDTEGELVADLDKTLSLHEEFLGQTSLTVEVRGLSLSTNLFQAIAEVFDKYPNLSVHGIESSAPTPNNLVSFEPRVTLQPPLIIRHTLRSGQRILHNGDIIVVGDVNPGSSLVAAGDVMVFGWLRGSVFAGQPADTSKTISALRFQPTQIRIGETIALGDGAGETPEYARIDDHHIIVESWTDVQIPAIVTDEPRQKWFDRLTHLSSS